MRQLQLDFNQKQPHNDIQLSEIELEELRKEGFNKEQIEVIKSPYPIVNLAGPGSGKTKTLIAKITTQVKNLDELNRVLVLTFTNNAANEIINRLSIKLNQKIDRRKYYTGTYHGMFFKLLKENYRLALKPYGFSNTPTVIDQDDEKSYFNLAFNSVFNPDGKIKSTELKDMFYDEHGLAPLDLLYTNNNLINRTPETIDDVIFKVQNRSKSTNIDEIAKIARVMLIFRDLKIQGNQLSFSDILMYSYFALKDNIKYREKIKNHFDYLLIDEYQDTNPIQSKIIDFISRGDNTCIIGDPYQSIYRFLGASVRNIIDKTELDGTNTISLVNNYRSNKNIVDFTNDIASTFKERAKGHQYCISANNIVKNNKIQVSMGINQEEYIVNSIVNRVKEGVPYNEIAILARTNKETHLLEATLRRNKLPFIKIGGTELWETVEGRYMVDLVKVLSKDYTFKSIENLSKMYDGLGMVTLGKAIIAFVNRDDKSLDLLENTKQILPKQKKLIEFLELLLGDKSKFNYSYFEYMLSHSNISFKEKLLSKAQTVSKMNEIEENIELVKSTFKDKFENHTLDEFKDFMSNLSLGTDKEKVDKDNAITISTVHGSKGLEWNDVYIINGSEGKFPFVMALKSYDPNELEASIEEEKRLFYVAISRAKENLIITNSEYDISRFVTPFLGSSYMKVYRE